MLNTEFFGNSPNPLPYLKYNIYINWLLCVLYMSIWNNFIITYIGSPILNIFHVYVTSRHTFLILFNVYTTFFVLPISNRIERNDMPYSLHHKFQYILRLKIRARLKATIMAAHVASRRSRCGAIMKEE